MRGQVNTSVMQMNMPHSAQNMIPSLILSSGEKVICRRYINNVPKRKQLNWLRIKKPIPGLV
jgi:hypothetical protein